VDDTKPPTAASWELRAEEAAKRYAELEAKTAALQALVQQSLATQPALPPPGGLPAPSHALIPAPSHASPPVASNALPPAQLTYMPPVPSQALPPAQSHALPPAQSHCHKLLPVPSHSLSLPQGWKSAVDPQNGVYYYNKITGVSQYERPTENSPPLPTPVSHRQEGSGPGAAHSLSHHRRLVRVALSTCPKVVCECVSQTLRGACSLQTNNQRPILLARLPVWSCKCATTTKRKLLSLCAQAPNAVHPEHTIISSPLLV